MTLFRLCTAQKAEWCWGCNLNYIKSVKRMSYIFIFIFIFILLHWWTFGDSFGFEMQVCDLFDSLEWPVCSVPVQTQPIYFNLDPVGDWSSAAMLYPERIPRGKGKEGPEVGHKPTCVWGIKITFIIAHCLILSRCRQEEFYEDCLTFLSRTHPYVGQKSIFSLAPNEPIYSCRNLDLKFYLGYFPLVLITSKKKEK